MRASDILEKCTDLHWWRVELDTSTRVVVSLESSLSMRVVINMYPWFKQLNSIDFIDYSKPIDSYLVEKSITTDMGLGFAETGQIYKPTRLEQFYEDYLIAKISQLPQ